MKSVATERIGVRESRGLAAVESGELRRTDTRSDAESGFGFPLLALAAVSVWVVYETLHAFASRLAFPTHAEILHFLGVPPGTHYFF